MNITPSDYKPKLLLVDDKPENLYVLEKLLKPLNVKMFKATSGNEALSLALQEEFVLILLDVQMPEMDGYEVIELMHSEKKLQQVPVIFITAYFRDEAHRLKGYELGAVDYLYKPLDEKILISKVKVFLDLYAQRKENFQLQQRYQLILDSAGEGIFGLNPDGRFNFVNPAAATLLGHTPDELIDRSLEIIMPNSSFANHTYNWEKSVIHQAGVTGYFHRVTDGCFLRKDGSEIPADYVITSIRGEQDEYLGTVVVFTDASIRKQNDQTQKMLQQAQKMEAIGQLTGGVAHDFNNILMAIQGNLELILSKSPVDDSIKKRIDTALNATERASDLTKRLLAFSRQQPLHPIAVNLPDLILNMIKLLQPTLGENIAINTYFPNDLWSIWVDMNQLENALMNLAINARDAMEKGGKLIITAENVNLKEIIEQGRNQIEPGDYVKISVSDEGSGMSAETLQHIFEPFFTTKGLGKGTGLGLSMTYGFVKQSNGHITVESELGNGTIFNLYLPKNKNAEPETQNITEDTNKPVTNLSGTESILIVEDEDLVRELTVVYLKELGYKVEEAANGNIALDILKQNQKFDLLITDVMMPEGVTGPDLANKAQEIITGLKVLFISGYSKLKLIGDDQLNSNEHYLSKPYKLDELGVTIRDILKS